MVVLNSHFWKFTFKDSLTSRIAEWLRLLLMNTSCPVNDQPSCNFMLFDTFRELEGKYIDYLSVLDRRKVVPVGPLVQEIVNENTHTQIMEWLDSKDESSTVFPMGEEAKIEEALAMGFLGRVGERGMVVEGWAPQGRILTDSSTGGFVSHCGWNSIMESLKFGVLIVVMPMHLDQPINSRLVEEIGVYVEVKRDMNGRLSSEEIRMRGEEDIDELVEQLLQLCKDSKLRKNWYSKSIEMFG
ncbi:cyanidin-3-O-glucoside 2-O-glucuronosyltransferase-like [Camellia sinensis]|uniref:cyanidin-3-O-glucoside 2-O-glucuronosyltransferase-like n=1 Tax=Camellia sinensis TaxID=4442 RepID=UPI0010358F40|nr:cyanidin-3-O-glucoside 2-O-glucuronosyltransferase-like [Camellia sinensis]